MFNKKNRNYILNSIRTPKYEELENIPIGEKRGRAVESIKRTSNVLHITKGIEDNEYVDATILQSIVNGDSMVILDPEAILYNRYKNLLFSKNYKIRYIDIDNPDTNTWNFFDNDQIDINNKNATRDVFNKMIFLLSLFENEFLYDEKNEQDALYDWATIFGAIYAYVFANRLLTKNKFKAMYDTIHCMEAEDLSNLFQEENDVTTTLWFEYNKCSNVETEKYLKLSEQVLLYLMEDDNNNLIGSSDLTFSTLLNTPSVYFFNSIPNSYEHNIALNILLNFIQFELMKVDGIKKEEEKLNQNSEVDKEEYKYKNEIEIKNNKTEKKQLHVNFIMSNIDTFPNLGAFIENMEQMENMPVSFIFTCSQLDVLEKSYGYTYFLWLLRNVSYISMASYDKINLEVLCEEEFEIPEFAKKDTYYRKKQLLLISKKYYECCKFDLRRHSLYYRISSFIKNY